MKTAILNVGVGGWHPRGSERLRNSILQHNPEVAFISFTDQYPEGSSTHAQVPYQFKPYAFVNTLLFNYDILIWMDSSVYLKKSIQPIIDLIEKEGQFMLLNGWKAGEWLCDNQLTALGITREESMNHKQLIGGVIGLNMNDQRALEFLDQWTKLSPHFKGPWTACPECSADERVLGSRHDQAFASVISTQLGMEWKEPQGYFDTNINADSILVAQGM